MQGKKLYVGNLSYSATEEELTELCSQFGTVESVRIFPQKGFGFVEMSSQVEAEAVKNKLNGYEFKGRMLKVDEARPREDSRGKGYKRNY